MGSQTDEAERRVREQRSLIERKVADLEGRVGDDLGIARDRVQHHVTHLPEIFPGGPRLMEEAEDHPLATLAGSLGLGVALGLATGGSEASARRRRATRDGRMHTDGSSAMGAMGGAMGGMLSGLGSSMLSPLRPYLEDMARDVISGFGDRNRRSATARAHEATDGATAAGGG